MERLLGAPVWEYLYKRPSIEIGWTWLAQEYHGKGLNNIVKYLMLEYGFEQLNAHRIEFKTDNAV